MKKEQPNPKSWQNATGYLKKNKKLLLGFAGVVSVASLLYFKNKKDDTPVFENLLVEMNAMEEQAVSQMGRIPYTETSTAAGLIKDSTLPIWQSFQQQVAGSAKLKLDKGLEEKRQLLLDYATLRIQQSELLYKALQENTNAYDTRLDVAYQKINVILDKLQN